MIAGRRVQAGNFAVCRAIFTQLFDLESVSFCPFEMRNDVKVVFLVDFDSLGGATEASNAPSGASFVVSEASFMTKEASFVPFGASNATSEAWFVPSEASFIAFGVSFVASEASFVAKETSFIPSDMSFVATDTPVAAA